MASQAIWGSDTSRIVTHVDAGMDPELALQYLTELSTDVVAGIVLGADGRRLAGLPELEEPARELLDAADAPGVDVRTAGAAVFAVRDEHHAIAVVTGRTALPALMHFDLRMVLGDLAHAG